MTASGPRRAKNAAVAGDGHPADPSSTQAVRSPGTGECHSPAARVARDYYNSPDADTFYHTIWGGEDIHIGLYAHPDEDIAVASRRTVERMADGLGLNPRTRVLDIGSGYGGAARYLATTYGCPVTCLNLSEVENDRNRRASAEQGLAALIDVVQGSFEELPFADGAFDVVWSQDAILHSGDRARVLGEVVRVLAPEGRFVFTDPMTADTCHDAALTPLLDRLHLESMGSPAFYRRELTRLGVSSIEFADHTPHLATHYGRVLEETERRQEELSRGIGEGYLTHAMTGLKNWVAGGQAGDLVWGIFHTRVSSPTPDTDKDAS